MNARCLLLVALAAGLSAGCEHLRAPPAADLVILGADVRTMDTATPSATAVAVRDGVIAFVGDDPGAARWIGRGTEVRRATGRTLLPGLIDSHIHVMEGALAAGACSLRDEQMSIDAAADIIRECDSRDADAPWLTVLDVHSAGFAADRHQLDAIVDDRPLLLWGTDGHTAWVNSRALAVAGITRDRANPADGRIERDADGEPTGFLVDTAVELATDLAINPTHAERVLALHDALPEIHAAGITTFLEANTGPATLAAYVELARGRQLAARVSFALASDGEPTATELARLKTLRAHVAGLPLLRADTVKLFADGVMEFPTQSAALLAPYRDAADNPTAERGRLYLEPETLARFVNSVGDAGFGVHIHAIGDAAVRTALDAFATARAAGSRRRYSLAHLQLVDAADLPRFGELEVFASLQLFWAQPDNYSVEALLPYIGAQRHSRLYPARSLLSHGATIAGGSDWNVSTFNPFEAMAIGMTRGNPEAPGRGTLNAAEALTLDELLAAYTIHGARMLGRDGEIGSISVGKAADLVLLDRRLTSRSSAAEVRDIKVSNTWFAGTQVVPQPVSPASHRR